MISFIEIDNKIDSLQAFLIWIFCFFALFNSIQYGSHIYLFSIHLYTPVQKRDPNLNYF